MNILMFECKIIMIEQSKYLIIYYYILYNINYRSMNDTSAQKNIDTASILSNQITHLPHLESKVRKIKKLKKYLF